MHDPDAALTLVLDPDNPSNTHIYDINDGRILYHVSTSHGHHGMTTQVQNLFGECIASWLWGDHTRSDVLTLGNGQPMSVHSWLKKSVVPFKDSVTFEDQAGRHYKWKFHGPGHSPECYTDNDRKYPIAVFRRSQQPSAFRPEPRHPQAASELTAQLFLDSRGARIQDLIIISLLLLEKNRRAAAEHGHS